MRRNVSKTPEYAVDKPKLDIMPVWVPARTANGEPTTVEYQDEDGNVIETRDKVKPLFVTYTEEQEPNVVSGHHAHRLGHHHRRVDGRRGHLEAVQRVPHGPQVVVHAGHG